MQMNEFRLLYSVFDTACPKRLKVIGVCFEQLKTYNSSSSSKAEGAVCTMGSVAVTTVIRDQSCRWL
jgi:hypothetical protein